MDARARRFVLGMLETLGVLSKEDYEPFVKQFVALDDKTFRIDFVRKDKMTMSNLAVTIPFVIDAELAQRNGGGDPWAKDWLKNNGAGSGAYRVESWKPGVEAETSSSASFNASSMSSEYFRRASWCEPWNTWLVKERSASLA